MNLVSRTAFAVALSVVIGTQLIGAWQAVSPLDQPLFDGPFQMYDALRRIDAGQLPGRDFPVYHGLGIPVVHYPIYRLFGGNIIASELARQLVSRFVCIGMYLWTAWLLARSMWPGLLWAIVSIYSPFAPFGSLAPGNSLLMFRSALPILFTAFVYQSRTGWRGALSLGAVLGLAWMTGVEQSLALMVGVISTAVAVLVVQMPLAKRLQQPPLVGAVLLGVVFAGTLTALLSGGHLLSVLKFYFVYMPTDQIWRFGAPDHFIGDGSFNSLQVAIAGALFAIGFAAVWLWSLRQLYRTDDVDSFRFNLALAVGASYGIVSLSSILGYAFRGYLAVPARIALVLATAAVIRGLRRSERWQQLRTIPAKLRLFSGSAIGVSALCAAWLIVQVVHLKHAHVSNRWESLSTDFSAVIKKDIPVPKTGDLWSTYAGLVEARLGIFQPQVDFIIHDLGPQRERYVQKFAELQPPFVQTMRRDTFDFEEWLEDTMWGFYERVLLNYRVVGVSSHSLLWRRIDQPWRDPDGQPASQSFTITPNDTTISVPAGPADAQIAVVDIDYKVTNAMKPIPILGNLGRYLVAIDGTRSVHAISLPPTRTTWEFPVFVRPGLPFQLRWSIRGPTIGSTLRVSRITVRYLSVPPANSAFLNPAASGS